MKFTGDIEQTVPAGEYNYTADTGAGAVTLTMSLSGGPFVEVTGGGFSADDTGLIRFGTCKVKAGLTSNAAFTMIRAGK